MPRENAIYIFVYSKYLTFLFFLSASPRISVFYSYIQKSGSPPTMTISTDYDSERNELGESLLSEIEDYRQQSSSKQYSKSFIVLPWTLVFLLFLFLVFLSYQDTTGPRQVYDGIFCEYSIIRVVSNLSLVAPAQHVLRRKDIVFTGGFDDPRTKYQGSGPDVNTAWDDLYQCMAFFDSVKAL